MAIGIHCCKDCVPPKRHVGCHSTCEQYRKEKIQLEIDKKKVKESYPPDITAFDFNKIEYASWKNGHRKRRRKR